MEVGLVQQEMENRKREKVQVVGVKELVDEGLLLDGTVPALYVRPPHERPVACNPQATFPQMPIIDLDPLFRSNSGPAARSQVVREIGRACEEWGFFQVINHGVKPAVIQQFREAALKFFDQPTHERMRFYSESFRLPVMYYTSFNPSMEKVRDWRDALGFNRYPGICNGFEDAPTLCKKEVLEYMEGVDALTSIIDKAICESLGLPEDYRDKEVPGLISRIGMSINYYPPCPDPSLTLGLRAHSDVGSLTILHPDDIPGLEIKHKGTWVPIIPTNPFAFVINLADQIEILTNGKYKSIEHRVVTNADKPRMSIACFYMPLDETVVAPLHLLIDKNHPPRYKPTKFEDYFQNYTSKLANRGSLDFTRWEEEVN